MRRLFSTFWPCSVALLVCGLAGLPAWSTTLVAQTLETLALDADDVVVATCGESTSRWANGKILTDTVLRPTQSLKKGSTEPIVLTHLGGRVSEPYPLAMRASGMPSFETGERVLVFVYQGQETKQVLGLCQGKLSIAEDSTVRADKALPAESDLAKVAGEPLRDVLARIEAILERAEAEPDKEVRE